MQERTRNVAAVIALSAFIIGALLLMSAAFIPRVPEYIHEECKLVFSPDGLCMLNTRSGFDPRTIDCNTKLPEMKISNYRDGIQCYTSTNSEGYSGDYSGILFEAPVNMRGRIVFIGVTMYLLGILFSLLLAYEGRRERMESEAQKPLL